jgi:hypothetical protein
MSELKDEVSPVHPSFCRANTGLNLMFRGLKADRNSTGETDLNGKASELYFDVSSYESQPQHRLS